MKEAEILQNSRNRIQLSGPFRLIVDDQEVKVSSRKLIALLAYLGRRSGIMIPRETLCGLLWADTGEDQARASLRQALAALRRILGPQSDTLLLSDKMSLGVDADLWEIDLNTFFDLTEREEFEAAQKVWKGEALEGFAPVTPEFDRWLSAERAFFDARHQHGLNVLMKHALEARDWENTLSFASRLLALNELQEHVHQTIMQVNIETERFDKALKQYEVLSRLLEASLGVRPDAKSQELAKRARQIRTKPSEAGEAKITPSPPVPPARPSIAVLRFKSMSHHEDAGYISEGVAEDIIIELSKTKDLFVVSGQSSLRLDPAETGPVEAGELLGVKYCLTGSVRIASDQMRLTVHLSSSEDGRELWAERFDRKLEDIFDVQTEVARIVTSTVSGRIIAIGTEENRRALPTNLAAYDYVLRGMHALELYTNEANNEALDAFKKAIELEPGYARAHGLLALAHAYDAFYYLTHDYGEAIRNGETALKLDPYDAKAHCALGMSRMILRDFNKAEHHFTTGLSASPNDDLLIVEYGRFEMYVDRTEKALETVRRAMRLNPYHANWYWNLVGRCLHTLGRFEEAIEAFEKVLNPQFFNWAYLAACHHALGNAEAANAARKRLYAEWPDFTLAEFMKVFPYKNLNTATTFRKTLEDAGIM